jgi:hypothetical protein
MQPCNCDLDYRAISPKKSTQYKNLIAPREMLEHEKEKNTEFLTVIRSFKNIMPETTAKRGVVEDMETA